MGGRPMIKPHINPEQCEYEVVLGILQEQDSQLTILYEPWIALSAHALRVAAVLEEMLPLVSLRASDDEAIRDYLKGVRAFCNRYFERPDRTKLGAACPLRLPCDSHDLLEAHGLLHGQYLDLRTALDARRRNTTPELRVSQQY